MEQDFENAESSQNSTEYHSNMDGSESEEASTTSDDDVFTSIQYPSPPPAKNFPLHFPKPYLRDWDFRDSDQALKYIKRYFNHKMIHKSLKVFPNLAKDFIYANTYMDSYHFNSLQCYINKSIQDWDAAWLELHMRYNSTSAPNPYIVQCILLLTSSNLCQPSIPAWDKGHSLSMLTPYRSCMMQWQMGKQTTISTILHFPTILTNLLSYGWQRMRPTYTKYCMWVQSLLTSGGREKRRKCKGEKWEMRKKAGKARKLHRMLNRALHQTHKLSMDGRGLPMWWWPMVKEWEEAVVLTRIKKEKELAEKEEWSIPLKIKKRSLCLPKKK